VNKLATTKDRLGTAEGE